MRKVSETAFEFDYAVVNVADDITTVNSGLSLLRSVIVNTTLSAHALPIKDGTTTVFTIPASATVGTRYSFDDAQFKTSIVIDPDNAATGGVTVIYKKVV